MREEIVDEIGVENTDGAGPVDGVLGLNCGVSFSRMGVGGLGAA